MTAKTLSRFWLLLGVAALAIAGLFSLILVVARTPSLSAMPLFIELFHKSLVVHVDLSVLVWFLAIACLMWSRMMGGKTVILPFMEEGALISFALGTIFLTFSPVDGKGEALMSNYIPVITSPLFFLGLSLIFCGVALMVIRLFMVLPQLLRDTAAHEEIGGKVMQYALWGGAFIAAIAGLAFFWAYAGLPHNLDPQAYYELLFWGGGHTLQFLHTQIVMVCWLMLMFALLPDFRLNKTLLKCLFSIGPLAAVGAYFVSVKYRADASEYRDFFTQSMIVAGGIAPTVLAVLMVRPMWWARVRDARWTVLLMSLVLFFYGGFLGSLIRGQNVVIPAHYHGSIVGITLAFMGAAFVLLPTYGYRDISKLRMAVWQPVVYGGGQLLHISGLAWSGGYGVLRKTPGGMEALPTSVKAAMGLMGLGGLIAIIGGFMFVIVVWRSVRKEKLA